MNQCLFISWNTLVTCNTLLSRPTTTNTTCNNQNFFYSISLVAALYEASKYTFVYCPWNCLIYHIHCLAYRAKSLHVILKIFRPWKEQVLCFLQNILIAGMTSVCKMYHPNHCPSKNFLLKPQFAFSSLL